MKKFEYLIQKSVEDIDVEIETEYLNKQSKIGWELVTIYNSKYDDNHYYYFKREIQ